MQVEQITVFLENQSGRLAEVASLLAEAGVNIRALTLADSADFGILRLIVSDTDKGRDVLKARGFTVDKTHVVAVEIPDAPGGLAHILNALKSGQINVEYIYASSPRAAGQAIMIFRFEHTEKGIACLQQAGVRILSGEQIADARGAEGR
jgi:hypothetical protein